MGTFGAPSRYFSGKPVLTVVQFCCLLLSSVVLCCPLLSFVVLCCPWWSSCSGCGAGLRGRQSPLENRIRTVCRDPERGPKRGQQSPPRKQIRAVCRGPKEGQQSPLQNQIRAVCRGFRPGAPMLKRRKAKSISYNVGNSTQVD